MSKGYFQYKQPIEQEPTPWRIAINAAKRNAMLNAGWGSEQWTSMTKDDIIKLAREAGFERLGTYASFGEDWVAFTESLEAFAALVAEHEREACAKVCEGRLQEGLNFEGCAATIRARGKKR